MVYQENPVVKFEVDLKQIFSPVICFLFLFPQAQYNNHEQGKSNNHTGHDHYYDYDSHTYHWVIARDWNIRKYDQR